MKIVSDITEADSGGTIRLGGTEVRFTNPRHSIAAGISMINGRIVLLSSDCKRIGDLTRGVVDRRGEAA